jgi:hypothetical protein
MYFRSASSHVHNIIMWNISYISWRENIACVKHLLAGKDCLRHTLLGGKRLSVLYNVISRREKMTLAGEDGLRLSLMDVCHSSAD